jgi:hypothetical protein
LPDLCINCVHRSCNNASVALDQQEEEAEDLDLQDKPGPQFPTLEASLEAQENVEEADVSLLSGPPMKKGQMEC